MASVKENVKVIASDSAFPCDRIPSRKVNGLPVSINCAKMLMVLALLIELPASAAASFRVPRFGEGIVVAKKMKQHETK